jgi:hypothetical protein
MASRSSMELTIWPREQHIALQEARKRQTTPKFKADYARRLGVEGVLSQGVRVCDLRRSRYNWDGQNASPESDHCDGNQPDTCGCLAGGSPAISFIRQPGLGQSPVVAHGESMPFDVGWHGDRPLHSAIPYDMAWAGTATDPNACSGDGVAMCLCTRR